MVQSHKPNTPSWIPYATMFKLEARPRVLMLNLPRARVLECLNCGARLDWKTYTLDPSGFDKMCHECKMTAEKFWKTKPHKELDNV